MSRNSMSKGSELHHGDSLVSNNGQFKAIFQDDGNFVIYTWKPVWSSDTTGINAARLCLQEDCNLVMYNQVDHPCWQANCHKDGNNMCHLQLTDDGKLLVFKHAETIWNSATSKGMR